MKEIITDLTLLLNAAKPVKLLTEDGKSNKEEIDNILNDIKEVLAANNNIFVLAAPQLGIDARVICIKFKDGIKSFINPVIIKKLKYQVKPETFASMPGKEILITRPEEVTVVYHNDELKYEENKLLGIAARFMDQAYQILDGVTPEELGLVSDVEHDGSLAELTDEEFAQILEIYKQFIKSKVATIEKNIAEDPELEKEYRSLRFTEGVITGHAALVGADPKDLDNYKQLQANAALSTKNYNDQTKAASRAQLNTFLRQKGKGKGKGKKK